VRERRIAPPTLKPLQERHPAYVGLRSYWGWCGLHHESLGGETGGVLLKKVKHSMVYHAERRLHDPSARHLA
jgi:hypothetical protein